MIFVSNYFGSAENPIKEAFEHATSKPAVHAVAEEAAQDAAQVGKNIASRGTGSNPPTSPTNPAANPDAAGARSSTVAKKGAGAVARSATRWVLGVAGILWPTAMGDGSKQQEE
jgi:hypothetical protein